MHIKRAITLILALSFTLVSSISVYADDTSQTSRMDQRIQALQTAQALRNKLQALQTEISTIKQLVQKATNLRKQVTDLHRTQLSPALQQARQAKNYPALGAALTDLKQVEQDLNAIKQLTQQNLSFWDTMRSLRQSKDYDGAMSALKQIDSNLQSKIDSYSKAQADINKAILDLKTPAAQ